MKRGLIILSKNQKEEEQSRLKDNIGARSNRCKLETRKYSLESRKSFLTMRGGLLNKVVRETRAFFKLELDGKDRVNVLNRTYDMWLQAFHIL